MGNIFGPGGGGDAATTFDDSTFYIFDVGDGTKRIDFDAGGTASTKTTIAASQTGNRVITLPDSTDTLVGKATTDVFTNKDLTAASNTYRAATDAVAGAVSTAAQTFAGAKTFNGGIVFSGGGTNLAWYGSTSNTVTASNSAGGTNDVTTASAASCTVRVLRIGSMVTCKFDAFTPTMIKSSAAGYILFSGIVPANYRPSNVVTWLASAKVNATYGTRGFYLDGSGNLRMYNSGTLDTIASGTTGIGWDLAITITYHLD